MLKSQLRAKPSEGVKFVTKLRPAGPWLLLAISTDRTGATAQTCTTREQIEDFILRYNKTAGVYYSINPTSKPINKKPTKKDIGCVEYLHVDADPAADESPEQCWARLKPLIKAFDKKPTFIISSGNGVHLLWRLAEPVPLNSEEAIADVEARNYALAQAFGASPETRNVDRILRVPGTVNWPNEPKLKRGRVPVLCELIEANDVAYDLADFPNAEGSGYAK